MPKWEDEPYDKDKKATFELSYADVLLVLEALVPFTVRGFGGGENARLVGVKAASLGASLSDQMQKVLDRDKAEFEAKQIEKEKNDATKNS